MELITSTRRPQALVALSVVAVLAAGCTTDDSSTETTEAPTTETTAAETTAPPETVAPVTTAAPETTTTAPATTTVATTTATPTTTTTTTTTTIATPTTVDTNSLAEGSGCTPGTTVLGDGRWFGYVDSADASAIEFDLACWFSGDGAILAAAEDGEESPPPNDYYIRNFNPQLRTIPVASSADVFWLPSTGDPSTQTTVPYADWLIGRATRGSGWQPGVWITIAGGEAAFIEEQFVP